MIHLYCTKKLAQRLPIQADGQLPTRDPLPFEDGSSSQSALSGWHANHITLQRRHCVLMVHDATRFPVFLPALRKAEFHDFDHCFRDAFMNTLLKCGAGQDSLESAHRALAPLVCVSQCNRSVLGSLNHMVEEIRWVLEYESIRIEHITGYRLGAWLADQPLQAKRAKDTIWPIDAMKGLLRQTT